MLNRQSRRVTIAAGVALTAAVALAGCSSGAGSSSSSTAGSATGKDPSSFTVLTADQNPQLATDLGKLASGACKAENKALPLQDETVDQTDVVQKTELLSSQNALPVHYIAGTSDVRSDGALGKNGFVLNYETQLKKLGVWSDILPAASSTVDAVYGNMVSLPYQYNIEGIWYNKAIFKKLGLSVPTTYPQLTADAKKIKAAGYTPFATDGVDEWPITRLIGMYIFRSLGPNAMKNIENGTAKLTSPKYVAAAAAVQSMAEAGDFGTGFTTTDAAAATNAFLTGKAAMMYDGSWLLSNINDPSQNSIGVSNVGLMSYPAVPGGAGNIDQWPANAGAAMAMNPKEYGPKVASWLKCIATNYGSQALKDAGTVSGFKVNTPVANVPAATKLVQQKVSTIKQTVLWFEALMDPKSTSLAQTNVSLLTNGSMTPATYMSQLQASIDANK
jgi:raffinose/stachyose/melibiose transport system substrate-binding protein